MNPAPRPCTVLIARPELLPALEKRARAESGELIALTDAEPLRALEVITSRRPDVIALERLFAATPRGAALINRLRADPSLSHTEIRVVADEDQPAPEPDAPPRPVTVPSQAIDQHGTRRAQRIRMADQMDVLVDGNQAVLVDLSTIGAQLVSPTVLRPNQRVRVSLADEQGTIRCAAVVAWASFEIPPAIGPRYRAGLEFFNPDAAAIDAFCTRHGEA